MGQVVSTGEYSRSPQVAVLAGAHYYFLSSPLEPDRWMLNYGARRYRASLAAGLNTIPAFVDKSHDEYDQVIENLQRSDLTPMEMAIFIRKKLADGEKKGAIEKKFGKDSSSISHFIALIDPPACIEDLYSTGRCTSAKVLYDLRGLHDKYPIQVEDWCSHMDDVTKRSVSELAEQLRGGKKRGEGAVVGVLEVTTDSGASDDSGNRGGDDRDSGLMTESSIVAVAGEKDAPNHESEPHQLNSGVNKIRRPLILVEFDGRAAAVLLNRRPTSPGLIHLKYEDGSGEDEVDAGRCKINCLLDSAA